MLSAGSRPRRAVVRARVWAASPAGAAARRRGCRLPGPARLRGGEGFCAIDERPGQVGQAEVAGPGTVAQQVEGLIHVHPEALGELALGLLDDDPAVQRGLQLFIEGVAVAHAALVQQADGGDVGQGLTDADFRGRQGPRIGAEQVQRPDDLLAQPHRQRLHGREPGLPGGRRETGPPRRRGGQVRGLDGPTRPEAVQAGTLVVLQLEQLKQPGGFAGGGHHPQLTSRVSQQQPGGGHVEQLHAAVGQHVQEVDHVEADHHRVSELNKRLRQQLSVHARSPSQEHVSPGAGTLMPGRPGVGQGQDATASAGDDIASQAGQPPVLSIRPGTAEGVPREIAAMQPRFAEAE